MDERVNADRAGTMSRPGLSSRPASASRARARVARLPIMLLTKSRLIWAVVALLATAIIVNAVAMQTAKHPEPLFERVSKPVDAHILPPMRSDALRQAMFDPKLANPPAGVQRVVNAPEKAKAPGAQPEAGDRLVSEIQRELSKRGHYKGEVSGKTGPATTQAIRDFQFAQRVAVDGRPTEALLKDILTAKANIRDELLDLVKRAQGDEPPQRTVRDVQRALNKAGYGPVAEDGQWGPGTKTALSKFEADRRLPPRGEPKGPVLRALASASGITIAQP